MSKIDPWGFVEEDEKELEIKNDPPITYKKGRYQVNLRVYDKGVLHKRVIRTNDLGLTVKTEVGDFDLKTNWLFKERKGLLSFILDRLRGVHQCFIAIYEKGQTEPFNFSLAYPRVSGEHLNTIRQSNALYYALKSWIQSKFDTKMLIVILVAVGMMGIFILYQMGYIDLGSLFGRS